MYITDLQDEDFEIALKVKHLEKLYSENNISVKL